LEGGEKGGSLIFVLKGGGEDKNGKGEDSNTLNGKDDYFSPEEEKGKENRIMSSKNENIGGKIKGKPQGVRPGEGRRSLTFVSGNQTGELRAPVLPKPFWLRESKGGVKNFWQ